MKAAVSIILCSLFLLSCQSIKNKHTNQRTLASQASGVYHPLTLDQKSCPKTRIQLNRNSIDQFYNQFAEAIAKDDVDCLPYFNLNLKYLVQYLIYRGNTTSYDLLFGVLAQKFEEAKAMDKLAGRVCFYEENPENKNISKCVSDEIASVLIFAVRSWVGLFLEDYTLQVEKGTNKSVLVTAGGGAAVLFGLSAFKQFKALFKVASQLGKNAAKRNFTSLIQNFLSNGFRIVVRRPYAVSATSTANAKRDKEINSSDQEPEYVEVDMLNYKSPIEFISEDQMSDQSLKYGYYESFISASFSVATYAGIAFGAGYLGEKIFNKVSRWVVRSVYPKYSILRNSLGRVFKLKVNRILGSLGLVVPVSLWATREYSAYEFKDKITDLESKIGETKEKMTDHVQQNTYNSYQSYALAEELTGLTHSLSLLYIQPVFISSSYLRDLYLDEVMCLAVNRYYYKVNGVLNPDFNKERPFDEQDIILGMSEQIESSFNSVYSSYESSLNKIMSEKNIASLNAGINSAETTHSFIKHYFKGNNLHFGLYDNVTQLVVVANRVLDKKSTLSEMSHVGFELLSDLKSFLYPVHLFSYYLSQHKSNPQKGTINDKIWIAHLDTLAQIKKSQGKFRGRTYPVDKCEINTKSRWFKTLPTDINFASQKVKQHALSLGFEFEGAM